VTYRALFPAIIPPPFFNSLIATVYSYRAGTPPVTGSDVTARPQYFASELVDWLRVDRAGCVDCDVTSEDVDDEAALCHHVLIELLAQSRVIQVSVTLSCCHVTMTLTHRAQPSNVKPL